METETPRKIHQGRNVRYWRIRRGFSQEQLGEKIDKSQQYIGKQEKKEEIEPEVVVQLAEALEVPVEGITDFEADMPMNFITNKVELKDTAQQHFEHSNGNFPTFNNYYHYYNCTIIPRTEKDEPISELLKVIEKKEEENK